MPTSLKALGKRNKIVHIRCRRCGHHSYHIRKKVCSHCGFGRSSKIKKENWRWKGTLSGERKY